MTERPRFKTKTAARRAYEKDLEAWEKSYADALNGYLRRLRDESAAFEGGLHGLVGEALLLHTAYPSDLDFGAYFGAYCPSCSEGCCDSTAFPCETFTTLAAHLELPSPPTRDASDAPKFADYWPDPYVTVTFAHYAFDIDPVTRRGVMLAAPMQQMTMPHSRAEHYYDLLLTTSRDRVKAMR